MRRREPPTSAGSGTLARSLSQALAAAAAAVGSLDDALRVYPRPPDPPTPRPHYRPTCVPKTSAKRKSPVRGAGWDTVRGSRVRVI